MNLKSVSSHKTRVMSNWWYVILIYLLLMNFAGFCSMLIDKRRAIQKKWRISERTLLWIAFFGGGVGSLLGMKLARHKTKHKRFTICVPIFAIAQAVAVFYFVSNHIK